MAERLGLEERDEVPGPPLAVGLLHFSFFIAIDDLDRESIRLLHWEYNMIGRRALGTAYHLCRR